MKKILIIVLAVLLLAVAVFFAPGILKPTIEYKNSVTINKSREDVWKVFSDETRMKEWLVGLQSIELVSGEKKAVGAKYRLVIEDQGEKIELFETVTEIKAAERYAFSLDAEPMIDNVVVTLADKDGKTEFVQSDSITGKNIFWKAVVFWLQSTFQGHAQQHLDNLKRVVEAE